MELYQLRTFVAVAEAGLLTKAAKRLNSSQPAVSAHIKALESELDITLFNRTPKGMQLTSEGTLLKMKALSILEAADDLKYTADNLKEVLSGDVMLGLHTDLKLLKTANILTEFGKKYPNLSLNYLQKMSWQAPVDILAGNLDAAFVYSHPKDPQINIQKLAKIQLAIVGPKAWQEQIENAKIEDLASFPWIWTNKQCPLYKIAANLFSKVDHEPPKAVIVDQDSAILGLVTEGVGLSLMPEIKAKEAYREGQIAVSNIPVASLALSLIYLKKRELDPIITAILDVVRKVWAQQSIKQNSKENRDALSYV